MAFFYRPLKAILWKNGLLMKKQWFWVVLEIIIPIAFFALLSLGRTHKNSIVNQSPFNGSSIQSYSEKTVKSFLNEDASSWQLWYSPSEDQHNAIIRYVFGELGVERNKALNFESNDELFEALDKYYGNQNIYAINFENDISNPLSYNISIRKRYLEWNSQGLSHENKDYNSYLHEGFLALQILIDKAYIESIFKYYPLLNITITLQQIPDYRVNNEDCFLSTILPLAIIFSLCLPIFLSVQKQMWRDEGSGMNDLMKVSGVPMSIILLGWFLQRSIMILFTLVPIVICLKLNSTIEYCHWSILFLFLFFYCMTAITAYLFIACAAKKSSIRFVIGLIFWILTYFLPAVVDNNELRVSPVYGILLPVFPNMALHLGCKILAKHESAGIEMNFGNVFSNDEQDVQMGHILLFLILGIILPYVYWIILFDLPIRLKQYFRHKTVPRNESIPLIKAPSNHSGHSYVTIKNLKKTFGVNTALDIPELELRQGEITTLLGTNGSGKSTLISIITGLITSYSGSVVFNKTGRKEPYIGFCPQKDTLFENLTVEQNLTFFAMLRTEEVFNHVANILEDLNLEKKLNDTVRYLSSGLRRKICLAIALVGDPQIIILDEPTNGLINYTRYSTREVLKKRSKTTIFIATGHGEEAEFLADNILLMHNGKILNTETSYSQLRKNDGCYITLLVTDASYRDKTEQFIKDNFTDDLTILTRMGKKIILNTKKETCLECIKNLEAYKAEWHIETISYNVYALSNKFVKYLDPKQFNLQEKNEQSTESNIKKLSKLFQNREFGFNASVLMKKWFFSSRKFHWSLPGLLIMLLFASVILTWTSEGRYYYSYKESPIELNLNIYNENTVFFSGVKQSQIDRIMKPYANQNNIQSRTVPDVNGAIASSIGNGTINLEETNVAGVEFLFANENKYLIDLDVNIVYSPRMLHSAAIAINLAMNAILSITKPNDSYSIQTNNVPVRKQYRDYVMKEMSNSKLFLLWPILMSLGMFFLLADYVVFPNIETTTQFLRLQGTSLKRRIWYWNLLELYDVAHGTLQIAIIFFYLFFLNIIFFGDALLSNQEFLIIFTILLVYVVTAMPQSHIFGALLKIDQCYTNFILLGIATGTIPFLIYVMFENSIASPLHHILACPFPQLTLGYNLYKFGVKFRENYNWDHMNPLVKKFVCRERSAHPCCLADSAECYEDRDYFNQNNFDMKYIFLLSTVTYILWHCMLVYVVSSPSFKAWKIQDNREDNSKNKEKIKEITMFGEDSNPGNVSSSRLEMNDVYLPVVNKVVKTCSFEPNKLYGIVGSNGSGKSLLLATLAKRNLSFAGEIYLHHSDDTKIHTQNDKYISEIGYYPGTDKLTHWLTGLELLTLAGISRGFSIETSEQASKILLKIFDLQLYANRKCKDYSLGKKKILKICAAFMGFSNFIVIDNVTRSLDLPIKKTLWDFFLAYKKHTEKTVILGVTDTERYIIDSSLTMDGKTSTQQPTEKPNRHKSVSGMRYFQITFRMKAECHQFKDQLWHCKHDIESVFKKEKVRTVLGQNLNFFTVEIKSNDLKLSKLLSKAACLKKLYPRFIEDYHIAEL